MTATTTWECVIPGKPKQKGNSKRIVKFGGKLRVIGDQRALKAAETSKSIAWAQRPEGLLSSKAAPTALVLDVDFVFAIPASRMKGKRALKPGDPHMQRPDRGNLLKMVEDVLEDVAYADDCVICDGVVRKVWGNVDETRISLRRA